MASWSADGGRLRRERKHVYDWQEEAKDEIKLPRNCCMTARELLDEMDGSFSVETGMQDLVFVGFDD